MKSHDKISRFDVYVVRLDPTTGHEVQKTRPAVVISPDEMNRRVQTVIIAPLTSTIRDYPTRITLRFQNREGQIMLDQIRSVDRTRLVDFMGRVDAAAESKILRCLAEMFAP